MLKHFLIDIKYGIQNIIKWWGLIWRDRDWDYEYIYYLLEFKLNNMYKAFSHDSGVHPNHLKKLQIAVLLLDRINKSKISDNDLAISVFRPYNLRIELENLMSKLSCNNYNNYIVSWNSTPNKKRAYREYMKHLDYLENQDIQMLHDLMNKYYKYWWD